MPFIHVRMFEGRTQEQKRAFVEAITRETVATLACSPEAVDVVIEDVRKSDWATGGRFWSDPASS
jgi:4-oxalocrotonate tautomerase